MFSLADCAKTSPRRSSIKYSSGRAPNGLFFACCRIWITTEGSICATANPYSCATRSMARVTISLVNSHTPTNEFLNRLGDLINKLRDGLELEPLSATEGPQLAEKLRIPLTYCWSPTLVPTPFDWPPSLGTCGQLSCARYAMLMNQTCADSSFKKLQNTHQLPIWTHFLGHPDLRLYILASGAR